MSGRVEASLGGGMLLLGGLCGLSWNGPGGVSVSGGKAGLGIEQGVRTPLRVALEARLALALCLPPMGAVNRIVSKRRRRRNSNRRANVKFAASLTARYHDAGEVAKIATLDCVAPLTKD